MRDRVCRLFAAAFRWRKSLSPPRALNRRVGGKANSPRVRTAYPYCHVTHFRDLLCLGVATLRSQVVITCYVHGWLCYVMSRHVDMYAALRYVLRCYVSVAFGATLVAVFVRTLLPPAIPPSPPPPTDGDGGMVNCSCFGVVSGLEIASTVTSMFLALWWLVVRNTAGYAWVLQVSTILPRCSVRTHGSWAFSVLCMPPIWP